MLRTRATQTQASGSASSKSTSTPKQSLTGRNQVHDYVEPDTPTAHYDSRTHVHARNESKSQSTSKPDGEIDPLEKQGREMNGPQNGAGAGLAGRRGEKSLFLDGLSRLQALGSGGKGKGKAQYRLGRYLLSLFLTQRVPETSCEIPR